MGRGNGINDYCDLIYTWAGTKLVFAPNPAFHTLLCDSAAEALLTMFLLWRWLPGRLCLEDAGGGLQGWRREKGRLLPDHCLLL